MFSKLIKIYLFTFVSFSFSYIFLFHTFIFSGEKVLFYRGLLLLFTDSIVFSIFIIIYYFKFSKKNFESKIAALIVSISLNLSFFIIFPVTFERSISMFLLNSINRANTKSCLGLSQPQLEKKLINEYIITGKALNKRLDEQKKIKTITGSMNCIQLTSEARQFIYFSNIIKKLFDINNR